ncbi:WD40 repeat [Dillenia turbinata]|uniref:WD40 repeat n=1 Tax=Dillenia turbinata TaxID=194707 RepID=A0AAN8V7C8_9MAGN
MTSRQTCRSDDDSQSYSNHLHSYSKYLSSQPNQLPVNSILPYPYQQDPNISTTISACCITTLTGHTSYISSLAIGGKFLYTGSSDNDIRAWIRNPLNSGQEMGNPTDNIVAIGKGAVKSLVVLADKLFSAHQDHKIRVWRINNHENFQQKCIHLATLPTLGDRALKLLTPNSQVQVRRHKKCTWVHHVDTVSALALSQDQSLLYSASWDRSFKIWQTSDLRCLESVGNAHDDAINALVLSDDGYVYTGSADKKIKVWRKIPGEKKHSLVSTLEKHNSGINALALSNDGLVLYSGACDRSIVVWEKDDVGDMMVVGALSGHAKAILCLAVVSDLVFSGSADKTIRIWRGIEKSYSCLAILEGHRGPVKCLTTAFDYYNPAERSSGYLLYSGSLDCDIKMWQIQIPVP